MPGKRSVVGLVAAAGSGSRFGPARGVPKQFLDLGGEPVLVRSVRALLACEAVSRVVCAVADEWLDRASGIIEGAGLSALVRLVAGGSVRQETVRLLLEAAAEPEPPDVVLIHDAARPFVPATVVEAATEAARETGAAVVAAPTTDTIASEQDGFLARVLCRTRLVNIRTPQAFRFDLIREAHARAFADGLENMTDDSALVLRLGQRVAVVMGPATNIKITTPLDLELARLLIAGADR
ncbi:MAG: 2-C-methyl-D-erythritol 4-phosphate cytidylyltransferase [Verrucomicrobia bacterium]|nr:2-C-methyl-D-erythritol 4-phosphate cytidylyltransferase [Verrucomicrobiota bacterium]